MAASLGPLTVVASEGVAVKEQATTAFEKLPVKLTEDNEHGHSELFLLLCPIGTIALPTHVTQGLHEGLLVARHRRHSRALTYTLCSFQPGPPLESTTHGGRPYA